MIFTSTNEQALQAFTNMIPEELRSFCVGLPLENEKSGLRDLKRSMEDLIECSRNARADVPEHLERKDELSNEVNELNREIQAIDESFMKLRRDQKKLTEDQAVICALKQALQLGHSTPGLARAALGIDGTSINKLLDEACGLGHPDVSFDVLDVRKLDQYVEYAKSKATGDFRITSESEKSFGDGVRVGGVPVEGQGWNLVVTELERRKNSPDNSKIKEEVLKYGCLEALHPDGSFKNDFVQRLQDASKNLKPGFKSLEIISRLLIDFDVNTREQKRRSTLIIERDERKRELIKETTLANYGQNITDNDLLHLNDFCQLVGTLNDNAMADDTERLKVDKTYSELKAKFRVVSKIIPFCVMTHDQLREMVDPTDPIGLIIVDEASQSEFTTASCKSIGSQTSVLWYVCPTHMFLVV